ncbi:preprotein translocase subunit SecG [Oceaniovalibus guishaninsula JLT2003]|uniref:Protein-export membrane protein SecG n=1 Tax=Oceaniovalibus guishaninsula JLT2003 TaxID=1231392 RepID=K2HNF3_9RHOB|nr:preprotein translocase subunit SecG [Oceaniovalibus guishaninsula]EKE44399.1 preprotein translocase subunit SecG [Oceaniovalibus guishaninsula JLT2003]
MQNIVLIVHLLLALCLIGAVLLQRSEGGGLGMGGGGGVMSSRGAATALGKMTWGLAICFIGTSIALTIFAAENAAGVSVIDRLGIDAPAPADPAAPALPSGDDLLPPPVSGAPVAPPRAD